ncbi:hypothetical protein [Hydrogenibacillus schlegelii]|uniref:hypothetical protein n=1 Tax=Hydrogenibacillus schlegelii TaxID=1484 RepID=UPI00349FF474
MSTRPATASRRHDRAAANAGRVQRIVHRGHQAVLRRAVERAEERGAEPALVTFHPHPRTVLGRTSSPLISRPSRRRCASSSVWECGASISFASRRSWRR